MKDDTRAGAERHPADTHTTRAAGGATIGDEGVPGRSRSPSAADLAGVGLQFTLAILVFLFIGKWLDAKLGTAPWLLILGAFLGAGAGFYSMYRKVFPPKPKREPPS